MKKGQVEWGEYARQWPEREKKNVCVGGVWGRERI